MTTLRPPAKAGIVALGVGVAFGIAWLSVYVRQRFTSGPDTQASSGMYAAGDAMLGLGVFGLLTLAPLGLGLFWLRPVAAFWSMLAMTRVLFSLTGLVSIVVSWFAAGSPQGWWMLLSLFRIGVMPLGVLGLLTCALFAPQWRQRGVLLAAAAFEGAAITGVVLVKFILPALTR